jgi:hypothetical protein
MAKKLDAMPVVKSGSQANRYPWDEWLNGEVWQLERGTDFIPESSVFATFANRKVRDAGLALRVSRQGNLVFIGPRT